MFLLLLVAFVPRLHAQETMAANNSAAALPDAPVPAASTAKRSPSRKVDQDDTQQIPVGPVPLHAPRLAKYIEPGQIVVHLSATDKLQLAAWEQVQPYAFSTEVLAAAWEHLIDSDPKYGSDKAGFGERLGAAAIRQSSQAIFSDGVLPALLHQDPRYYRKGSGKFIDRVLYSASRVFIIRNDAGKNVTNYSQLIGYAGASALTMTYYPAVSATWHNTAESYGVSLAVSALGNQLHEFGPDLLRSTYNRFHRYRRH